MILATTGVHDLKERIPYLYFVEHFTVKEIGQILGVKKSLIYTSLAYYRHYGVAYNPKAFLFSQRGRQQKLDATGIRLVKSLLAQDPCLYLDELQEVLLIRRNVSVSVPTLLRTLRRLHFSRKNVSVKAIE